MRDRKTNVLFSEFPRRQLDLLRRLDTPRKVQDFLDYEVAYDHGQDDFCTSALTALKRRRAHCLEGALLAAAAFLFHGRQAWLLDLRANARDDDHVIAPFQENGRWGAVAMSRFCGLRYREPVHRSYGELARSYFEFYYNDAGEKTLREFSAPLGARRLRPGWLGSRENVFFVSRRLDAHRHYAIVAPGRRLRPADSVLRRAEVCGGSAAPLTRSKPRPYPGRRAGKARKKAVRG